jgi:4-aminobutyrate aminotransferase-like enzyme
MPSETAGGPPAKKHCAQPTPYYNGPDAAAVKEERTKNLADGLYTFYKEPVMIVRGHMQHVYDESGKQYLDAYNNVQSVGHCHPHVTKRITETLSTMGTLNTRYLNPLVGKYCEKLRSVLPSELDTFVFVNSGSEANDLAIRLARNHTHRNGVIALQNAYHGVTGTCTGVSTCLAPGTPIPIPGRRSTAHTNDKNEGCLDHAYYSHDVRVVTVPDNVRGQYKYSDPEAGTKYAHAIQELLDHDNGNDILGNKWDVAAFIHESVQGCGGQVTFPDGYLQSAYQTVRAAGGLCIADEVQVGFARSGEHFWAFESQGVVPDILTLGKPVGNGHPLGVVVMRKEIAKSFALCQFFSTFGGNPTSCAAGLAVLEAIEQDNLRENCRAQSVLLMKLLGEVKARHSCVAEIRGLGLFVGIEVVVPGTNEPDPQRTVSILEISKSLGLLVGKGGPHGNVIRIKGPLCLTQSDVHFLADVLEQSIVESGARK